MWREAERAEGEVCDRPISLRAGSYSTSYRRVESDMNGHRRRELGGLAKRESKE